MSMIKKVVAISALVGSAAALLTCLVFFFFVLKPAQSVEAKPTPTPTTPPQATPFPGEIPNPEIKAANIRSIEINTVYKGYFEPVNKCAKTYNEYFGNEDGIGSSSSPCTIKIKFDRDGGATRSIEISRWDKTAKAKKVVEKTVSTAAVTPEQFDSLAQTIVTNEAFKAWREGTMITVSNCSITVTHSAGVQSVMANVDERTTAYLPMVDAFKRLEKQLSWKPVAQS